MLIVLLYHRIAIEKGATRKENLFSQLSYLADHFPILLPGDPLEKGQINLCLTFDDGYFDFYEMIFPFLLQKKIPSLLSIPTGLIREKCSLSSQKRLQIGQNLKEKKAPDGLLCTWEEINLMAQSNLIQFACHSYSHSNLKNPAIDREKEIFLARKILEERTKRQIETFVYPMGLFNHEIHSFVKKHFRYIFRIGNGLNFSWDTRGKLLYRIPCDEIKDFKRLFQKGKISKYFFSYLWNRLRKR